MSTSYNTQFEIDLNEMEIIEQALREQARSLSLKTLEQQQQNQMDASANDEGIKSRMSEIQSVLGKLHGQKAWYVPKEYVPQG